MLRIEAPNKKNRTESEKLVRVILLMWITENNIRPSRDVKQETAVYRTVRTVV